MLKVVKKASEKLNPKEIHKSYLDQVEDDLKQKKVTFFVPGENLDISDTYLSLPHEITAVTSKDLGEYLNAFTQQKMYMRTMFGRLDLLVEESRRKYHTVSEPIYKKLSDGKLSETAKDRLINGDAEVKHYYEEYIDCKRKQSLIEYAIQNIEDAIFLISREVTRRTGDFSEENRNHNVGRK